MDYLWRLAVSPKLQRHDEMFKARQTFPTAYPATVQKAVVSEGLEPVSRLLSRQNRPLP